jgi:hypothetical protein
MVSAAPSRMPPPRGEQTISALTGMPVAELHQALQQAGKLSDLRAFSVQEIPASVLNGVRIS